MTLFWIFLATIVFFILVFARLLAVATRWGRELKELQAHGVETTGIVRKKVSYNTKGGRSRYIRYEYTDQFGRSHSRKTIVVGDAWEQHQEGGPIAVMYSERTPSVSAARFLFDTMVNAARAKGHGPTGPV